MKLSQEALNKIRVASKLGKDRDIQLAVDLALGEINAKRHWQEEVGEWISVSLGYFHLRNIYKELGALNTNDMCAIRVALDTYKNKGVIEPWEGKGYGWWRRKETDLVDIDWENADENSLDIKLPLGLDKMVNLYHGDIFVIAGESQAGKSAMCLNIVELNMHDWECHYFSSELSGQKLKKRISFFGTPREYWNMPTHDRHGNYHDVLFPNSLNIIDFLMITDDFWKVGNQIKDIHIALRKTGGIAIIALQKDENKTYGRGGEITRELASLYITLSQSGWAKIIKLKDWKGNDSSDNKICEYRLENASKFIQRSPWHAPEGGSWWKK